MSAFIKMTVFVIIGLVAVDALAQQPLDYWNYQGAMRAAFHLDHVCTIDTLEDDAGPYIAVGDRFGLAHIYHLTASGTREVWVSKQLNGVVQEIFGVDLDGDERDEIVAWTNAGVLYVWSADEQRLLWESLTNDFRQVHCVAVGQMDDDEPREIVINADTKLHYVDGTTYNREWTSPLEYQAERMAIGDVDGDGADEVVLNTGQVIDARSGDVDWDDQVFGARIVLMDIDGDGIPEILSESDGAVLRIFDADVRREKHLQ